MDSQKRVEQLLARYIEHHVLHGERITPEKLCEDSPELLAALRSCVSDYERLERSLGITSPGTPAPAAEEPAALPVFEGFRTIEQLGSGGGGAVYKLEDLALGRTVAAKVIRADHALHADLDDFLREARTLALFEDPRIVRIYEYRATADPPVILMEYVDGFELSRIGRSLEFAQRAKVIFEICDAIHHAHQLGIQHRDLKPSNIMLDAKLSPRILDFGLSRGEPHTGHGKGTPAYMAPEQLDTARLIDARSDVYSLGVMLYEILCGELPYQGRDLAELLSAIDRATPRLPVEIDPQVPEPLQAIALKALDPDPAERYSSAREMALELQRYLEGKPVLARPRFYSSALQRRLRPHLEQIREWLRIKLIYPHEATRLTAAYAKLESREDDWIVHSRALSASQISLYLGVFLLVCGGLLYFSVYLEQAVAGLAGPMLALGLPCAALIIAAELLYRRERQPVAVAFYLGAVILLPLFLLIFFAEAGLWLADPQSGREFFEEGIVSNRQLQLASLAACACAGWLALKTRTLALSSCFTALLFTLNFAILTDFGLRAWFEEGRWDRLALYLLPLFLLSALLGRRMELNQRSWFTDPLYISSICLYVLIIELLALNGKALSYLGLTMVSLQEAEVSSPLLLDTVTAMTLNGLLIYGAGWLLDRAGTKLMQPSARLLYMLTPFTLLEPLAYLNGVDEYSRRFDWLYLALALSITYLSHFRQRKSFYYAGLLNTGVALWLITSHYEWFDRPAWAMIVLAVGIAVLLAGFGLASRERSRRADL